MILLIVIVTVVWFHHYWKAICADHFCLTPTSFQSETFFSKFRQCPSHKSPFCTVHQYHASEVPKRRPCESDVYICISALRGRVVSCCVSALYISHPHFHFHCSLFMVTRRNALCLHGVPCFKLTDWNNLTPQNKQKHPSIKASWNILIWRFVTGFFFEEWK